MTRLHLSVTFAPLSAGIGNATGPQAAGEATKRDNAGVWYCLLSAHPEAQQ